MAEGISYTVEPAENISQAIHSCLWAAHDMCGLIGVIGTLEAPNEVFLGLMNLQHRGQDGAGILTHHSGDGRFNLQKGSGLIENIFSERTFKNLRGRSALGHTRYATVGRRDPNLLQPFLDNRVGVAIGHNGNIVNYCELTQELAKSNRYTPSTDSDSEVILRLLTDLLGDKQINSESLFQAVEHAMHKLVGSYAVVGLLGDGSLFGFRDPHGIRPLVLGTKVNHNQEKVCALASESVSLDYLGYSHREEIQPGEAVFISGDGTISRQTVCHRSYSPCMFEWVYFARVESEMGHIPLYEARFQLGLLLAEHLKELGIQADIVVPVPETSRAAAIAISEAMSLPFREVLIKNRYVNRTFILDDNQSRQEAIHRKLFPIQQEIKGKHCLVVDDSIVRGNTAKKLVQLLRESGALSVTLVSTCPPIRHPCYYGIDFPSPSELIASGCNEEEIARVLGCDRVVYQTVEGLKQALNQPSLCTGCLTGSYPTDVSMGEKFEARRLEDRKRKLSSGAKE